MIQTSSLSFIVSDDGVGSVCLVCFTSSVRKCILLPKKGPWILIHVLFIYLFYLYGMVQNIVDQTSTLKAEQRGTTRGAPTARVGIQDDQGQIAINLARGQLSQTQAVSRPPQEGPSSSRGGLWNRGLTPNAPAVAPVGFFVFFYFSPNFTPKTLIGSNSRLQQI